MVGNPADNRAMVRFKSSHGHHIEDRMSVKVGVPRKDDPDKERGLYPKFKVERLNPEANLKHIGCEHFVLDLNHDQFAVFAIEAYADKAREHGYTKLANELSDKAAKIRIQWPCNGNETGFHTCGLPLGGCSGDSNE